VKIFSSKIKKYQARLEKNSSKNQGLFLVASKACISPMKKQTNNPIEKNKPSQMIQALKRFKEEHSIFKRISNSNE